MQIMTPLESLVASGTKLWLDSIDPDLVNDSLTYGATGATSNPIIVSNLIKTGRFDDQLRELMDSGLDDEAVAWKMTDRLVRQAQEKFASVHQKTSGNDGYVSFELDPLLEAADCPLSIPERIDRYIALGKQWAEGHANRMIKVPATESGLGALEELVAAGVTVNVTLIFTQRQYEAARDAVWRGAQRRDSLDAFKSVYSIFVSRIDVYTKQQLPNLSDATQGEVGIVNAKRIWNANNEFWSDKSLPLDQEMIFASTGTKDPNDPPAKYIGQLAGSDIQTNPPAMNTAIAGMQGKTFTRTVDQPSPAAIVEELDALVDFSAMEDTLMSEGLKKFADPQKALLALMTEKRQGLVNA
jgi:transaldolase